MQLLIVQVEIKFVNKKATTKQTLLLHAQHQFCMVAFEQSSVVLIRIVLYNLGKGKRQTQRPKGSEPKRVRKAKKPTHQKEINKEKMPCFKRTISKVKKHIKNKK